MMMNYQYHYYLISQIDDATQLVHQNVKTHDNMHFVLKTKLQWSKNVNEEQDAPWQHLFAAMDPVYCPHIALALWLELQVWRVQPRRPLNPQPLHLCTYESTYRLTTYRRLYVQVPTQRYSHTLPQVGRQVGRQSSTLPLLIRLHSGGGIPYVEPY